MLLTILFDQYRDVKSLHSATADNGPLRELHEKTVTDVVCEIIIINMVIRVQKPMHYYFILSFIFILQIVSSLK